MKILINNRQRKTVLSQERLRKRAAKILSALELSEEELSLTLLGDRAMARLNRETFGRRGPTNVIAFPLDDAPSPGGPPPLLGEVVISLETTLRQAREFGWLWRELLDFFLIHGILHLVGYDHLDPVAEAHMTARTWELMTVLHPGRSWDLEPAPPDPENHACPP
jgi:probable rRNA maturation factor